MTVTPGFLLLGAGAIALAMQPDEDGAPSPASPVSTPKPVGTRPLPVATSIQKPPAINIGAVAATIAKKGVFRGSGTTANPMVSDGGGNWYKGDQVVVDRAVDEVKQRVKKEYDQLQKGAKKAGAEYLNSTMDPSPNLTGNESFEEASKKIGSVGGAAAGGAVCAAVSAGAAAPACAYLGSIAGAYLGKEVGPMLKDAYNKIEDWAGDAGDYIGDKAKDAYKGAKKVLGKLNPF